MFEGLLSPRGVVVVGASQNPTKLGYGVARNLVLSGYPGAIHFVNPGGGTLLNRPVYRDVASVPDPVDLAMIIVPAAGMPEVLEACGRRGIGHVIIGSGGFREIGGEGTVLEQRCLEIARKHGLRVIGPNCIGYVDTHLPIDTTFLPLPGPLPGEIAFLSHSGAICEAVIDWARGQGFGLSRLISLGNQMDLTESDLLPAVAADPHSHVVAMYLEGVRDGRQFLAQASRTTREKPVVAMKVGRSEQGRVAVASHTGALAGRDTAYEAAFRKSGVIRAQTTEEMFDWARALAWCPLPHGRRVAILTNAGGPGAIAADALDPNHLLTARLSEGTLSAMRPLLPAAASLQNPIDMLAYGGPLEYATGLNALLVDEGVDSILVIIAPPPMSTAIAIAGAIIPVLREAPKPVLVTVMGDAISLQAANLFRQARIPEYRFPERAVSALRVLAERAEMLAVPVDPATALTGIQEAKAAKILAKAVAGEGGFIDPHLAAEAVAAYGVSLPVEETARSAEEAEAAAQRIGFPVALKILSADLPHKSDIGGVLLGLHDETQMRFGFQQVMDAARLAAPAARIDGVSVQAMLPDGQDLIVGMLRDEQFGPLMMIGSGGVEVEGSKDVAFGLAPLTVREAETMLDATWAGRRLRGYRNSPAADRGAVIEAMQRLAQLAMDQPQILELEINPLRVFPGKPGAMALDIRLKIQHA